MQTYKNVRKLLIISLRHLNNCIQNYWSTSGSPIYSSCTWLSVHALILLRKSIM